MEEITNATTTVEDTTPIGTGTSELTDDNYAETTQRSDSGAGSDNSENVRSDGGNADGANTDNGEDGDDNNQTEQAFVTVKFNKQFKTYSAAEAQPLIQKGLNYERLSPVLEQAKILAAENNQSIAQFIGELYDTHEDMLRKRYMEASHGDEALVEQMMKQQKQMLADKSGELDLSQDDDNDDGDYVEKIAGEFLTLQKQFPEYKNFSDLNPEVLQTAQRENISLLDAKLRLDFFSRRQSENAQKQKEKNSGAALGSAASKGGADDSDIDAMMKGIWG